MKQKILFMVINMNIGGTEKALLNMISEIPRDKYEVTILMLEKYGGFLNEVPSWVDVKYLDNYSEIKPILNNPPKYTVKEFIKKGNILRGVNIGLSYYSSKLLKDKGVFFKYILKNHSKIPSEYDLAVAYAGPMDFISYYVLNKIKAKKKVQWIHFDVEKIGFNLEFAKKYYIQFNKVFIVSQQGKEKLINKLPELKNNIDVFYNIVPTKLIKELAEIGEGFNDDFEGKRILTVGRLSKEKGQDLSILALKKLVNDGYNVRLYLVGDGNDRERLNTLIKENNLEYYCVLLGSKKNPYRYMRECDIYLQSSRHEGYCITLAEVKCFNVPIITTNFTGASEQMEKYYKGSIVGISSEQIFEGIKKII